MTDLTKNPDLRSREKIDDYFGDWKWREGLAELWFPLWEGFIGMEFIL